MDVSFLHLLILEHCSLHISGCFLIEDVLKCRSLKYLWVSVSLHRTLLNLTSLYFTLRTADSLFPRLLEFDFQVWGGQCHWLFSTSECLSFCRRETKLLLVTIAQYPLVFQWMAASLLLALVQQNTSAEEALKTCFVFST